MGRFRELDLCDVGHLVPGGVQAGQVWLDLDIVDGLHESDVCGDILARKLIKSNTN